MSRVVAITGALSLYFAVHATGAELTDRTLCADAIKMFDTTGLAEVDDYIKNEMNLLDRKYTENGEPGIIAHLSHDDFSMLLAVTTDFCRDHSHETVYDAAAHAYNLERLDRGERLDKALSDWN